MRTARLGLITALSVLVRCVLVRCVLARLRFVAADQPPQVQLFFRPASAPLANAVETMVKGYRMPCFEGAEAINSTWEFFFRLDGLPAFGFKALTLPLFISHVHGIKAQTLQMDTSTMGCPFDLRFAYLQPYMANTVAEIGDRDPARRPLLAWLAAQHLDLPRRALDAVFADSTVITVPCARIDLKPKESP